MSASTTPVPLPAAAENAGRLGVLGGSFDPPHRGHLHAARAARAGFQLDHVIFVPAAQPPHKPERRLASGSERLEMLALLLADEPDVSTWGVELVRTGPSYTVDTLRELRRLVPATTQLYFILGADNLAGFARWRASEEIVRLAQPIVVRRAGAELVLSDTLALSAFARTRIDLGYLAAERCDVSSSTVRQALERGEALADELPRRLLDYVRRRGLYRAP